MLRKKEWSKVHGIRMVIHLGGSSEIKYQNLLYLVVYPSRYAQSYLLYSWNFVDRDFIIRRSCSLFSLVGLGQSLPCSCILGSVRSDHCIYFLSNNQTKQSIAKCNSRNNTVLRFYVFYDLQTQRHRLLCYYEILLWIDVDPANRLLSLQQVA